MIVLSCGHLGSYLKEVHFPIIRVDPLQPHSQIGTVASIVLVVLSVRSISPRHHTYQLSILSAFVATVFWGLRIQALKQTPMPTLMITIFEEWQCVEEQSRSLKRIGRS